MGVGERGPRREQDANCIFLLPKEGDADPSWLVEASDLHRLYLPVGI